MLLGLLMADAMWLRFNLQEEEGIDEHAHVKCPLCTL